MAHTSGRRRLILQVSNYCRVEVPPAPDRHAVASTWQAVACGGASRQAYVAFMAGAEEEADGTTFSMTGPGTA